MAQARQGKCLTTEMLSAPVLHLGAKEASELSRKQKVGKHKTHNFLLRVLKICYGCFFGFCFHLTESEWQRRDRIRDNCSVYCYRKVSLPVTHHLETQQ